MEIPDDNSNLEYRGITKIESGHTNDHTYEGFWDKETNKIVGYGIFI